MTKEDRYRTVLLQLSSLLEGQQDTIACMANISAVLHQTFGFWWTGFYRVQNDHLILGPFQGTVACMNIPFGRGVCGTAWQQRQSIIVPDVHAFPGHIACSSESNSEIVVPVFCDDKIIAVLDIDSTEYGAFDETDRQYLEQIVQLLN